jgi:hypothetical protein
MAARGTLGPLDACSPVADLQHTLAQLRRIRDYEAFKAFYLPLDPELTNSPAFLQALMAINGFDWLETLLEETFGEEELDTVEQPRHRLVSTHLPMAA